LVGGGNPNGLKAALHHKLSQKRMVHKGAFQHLQKQLPTDRGLCQSEKQREMNQEVFWVTDSNAKKS